MKPLFDPSLISLDNAAEDFWQEYKRKRGLPVERVSESDLIKAEVELFDTMSKHSGQSPAECRQLLKEELGKLPKRETESEADRKFIESMDKIREANANVKKRFSWAGVLAFVGRGRRGYVADLLGSGVVLSKQTREAVSSGTSKTN